MLNSEEIKPIALVVIGLHLSEGIGQIVSQVVSQSVEKYVKFYNNLMQRFRVDLKIFLGLAMPNLYCHVVTKLILGWFVGGIFGQVTSNLNDPYIWYYRTI